MKISNSKKQLAKIISENGGWRDGAEFAAQDRYDMGVDFYARQPRRDAGDNFWHLPGRGYSEAKLRAGALVTNWHQTILSRDEYFHLYPALGELCSKVTEENRQEPVWTNPPSIEQLAADYRNRKDYADRKQQEADAAKADADAKLAELVAAGKALGLVLSAAGVAPEYELVITDWRDLRVGDVVWYGGDDGLSPGEYHVMEIEATDYEGYRTVLVNGDGGGHWIDTRAGWGFIRRSTKGEANA